MKTAIITGVSKGLGESIAILFLKLGINVLGISRTSNELLVKIAKEQQVTYKHFICDLGDTEQIEQALGNITKQLSTEQLTTLYVINNAATVDPIEQAMRINNADLIQHIQVNTIAPMIVLNTILKEATAINIPVIGVNITSGAADRPVYGWSAYCSTKASINMYTETVALEQEELKTGNTVIAFNPGIMDTEMQGVIRSSSEDSFIDVDAFKAYKRDKQLRNSNAVGEVLVNILTDGSPVLNGKNYSVHDFL